MFSFGELDGLSCPVEKSTSTSPSETEIWTALASERMLNVERATRPKVNDFILELETAISRMGDKATKIVKVKWVRNESDRNDEYEVNRKGLIWHTRTCPRNLVTRICPSVKDLVLRCYSPVIE